MLSLDLRLLSLRVIGSLLLQLQLLVLLVERLEESEATGIVGSGEP